MRHATSTSSALWLPLGVLLGLPLSAVLDAQPRIETWPLCELVGPSTGQPGVYGTDLGFTFVHGFPAPGGATDERLVFLFGDTWFEADSLCRDPPPREDDVQATLRLDALPRYAPGPPVEGLGKARCPRLDFGPSAAVPPLRLFEGEERLPLGYIRTPLAGWSNGERVYALFGTGELARCRDDDDCAEGLECSRGQLGTCGAPPCPPGGPCPQPPLFADTLPEAPCRLESADCATRFEPHLVCLPLSEPAGLCVDPTNSLWLTDQRTPRDPRTMVTLDHHVAVEDLGKRGEYHSVQRLTTRKLLNPSARTVAAFDPSDPARNDYRSGHDTLLVWGRPAFVSLDGTEAWVYLLYNKLQPLSSGLSPWRPFYYAGLSPEGTPAWNEDPSQAQPLYRGEFDLVAQFSMSWVEPLRKWVMLYSGDLPAFFTAGGVLAHPQPVKGAVFLRHADHPWGAASDGSTASGGWSEPLAVVAPAQVAGFLACEGPGAERGCAQGDPYRPGDFFLSRALDRDCRAPGERWDRGNLYGVNIIDVMTQPVEPSAGNCAAEIYWNVSTWNPYRVLLMKSRIELETCSVKEADRK